MNPLTLFACSTLVLAAPAYAQKAPEPVTIPAEAAEVDPMEILAGSAATWKVTAGQFEQVRGR